MPASERRSVSRAIAGRRRVGQRQPRPVGRRQDAGRGVGQEIDVGLDPLGRRLAQAEDPDRDPRVRRRDRDVDRRAVADRLAAGGRGIGVEARGQEDRAPLGIEVEDLGGVGREAEAMGLGPRPDVVAAALEDGDVQGVDPRLERTSAPAAAGAPGVPTPDTPAAVSRMSRWRVQSPPRSTLDGTPGSGMIEPNSPPPPAKRRPSRSARPRRGSRRTSSSAGG